MRRILGFGVGAVLVAGCSTTDGPHSRGGQTGDESGGDGCRVASERPLTMDEVSPIGVSPSAALALAEGTETTALHWQQGQFPYSPESGQGELTITIQPGGGGARFVELEPDVDDGIEIGVSCPNRVEVGVIVEATTAGGALDERFEAVLRVSSPEYAELSHVLDLDALGGSFAFDPNALGDVTVYRFEMNAGFTKYGSFGALNAGFERRTADAVSDLASPPLAVWPRASTCELGGVPVPFQTDEPLSPANAVALTESARTAELTWTDGTRSALTLSFAPDEDSACALVRAELGETGNVEFDAVLTMSTADGRLAQDYGVRLSAAPDSSGALERLVIRLDDPCGSIQGPDGSGAAAFAEQCGNWGVPLDGYDGAHLELNLSYVPGEGGATIEGRIRVFGETFPDCLTNPPPPDPNGSAGCEGVGSVALAEFPVGSAAAP